MKNFIYAVMNADIPVIYIEVIIHICVKCLIRYSVKSEI